MGMLIEGRWREQDEIHQNGRYVRNKSLFDQPIARDVVTSAMTEPGRFWLIGSGSCPWSHRCMLVRAWHQLEASLPVHLAYGPRLEGYAANGGQPWQVPGSELEIVHLHQLYSLADPIYTGRSTVPILWDSYQQTIVSNESSKIVQFMDQMRKGGQATLFPERIRDEQKALSDEIYQKLNNGVYRAGFAKSQSAYQEAVDDVYEMMDQLEARLDKNPFLMGEELTYSDLQLFVTLVRFDAVYVPLHRCTRRRLVDYPKLWAYARRIFTLPGVAETVDWVRILSASFANDTDAKSAIVPELPELNWVLSSEEIGKAASHG